MVTGILADINAQGHVDDIVQLLQSEWRAEIWASLNLPIRSFADLGLDRDVADAALWHACQRSQVVLITRNRNAQTPDSLEMTIRSHNTPQCLPVFTLADADRIRKNKPYAERVADRLLEYLLEIDMVRGAGRLFLP